MTEKNTAKENIQQIVDEELRKAKVIEKKESIFDKAKEALTSDTAKKIYSAMAMGVVQGALARFTFDTLGELEDDMTIKIED